MEDKMAMNAMNGFFIQFIDHAVGNNCFDASKEKIVIGEIRNITKQVAYSLLHFPCNYPDNYPSNYPSNYPDNYPSNYPDK